jgi:hypothetical protein
MRLIGYVCSVIKGTIRISSMMEETAVLDLGVGDTLITSKTVDMVAIGTSAFIWMPNATAHDVAEASWLRRLMPLLLPIISQLLLSTEPCFPSDFAHVS